MCPSRKNILLLRGLFLALIVGPRLLGQAVTATLVGQVSDAGGTSVSAAKITITKQQTGITTVRPTNDSGNYEFTFLPPGISSVLVKHEGFDVAVTNGVHVAVNTTVRVDMKLQVGSVSQQVSITDSAPCCRRTAPMSAANSNPNRSASFRSVEPQLSSPREPHSRRESFDL